MNGLIAGDLAVRSALALSYGQLTGPHRLLLRRLALLPGRDTSPDLAALLTGDDDPLAVEDSLDLLVDRGLLEETDTRPATTCTTWYGSSPASNCTPRRRSRRSRKCRLPHGRLAPALGLRGGPLVRGARRAGAVAGRARPPSPRPPRRRRSG